MTAPDEAVDDKEGCCEECTDWFAWGDLFACTECDRTLCAEHWPEHGCPSASDEETSK